MAGVRHRRARRLRDLRVRCRGRAERPVVRRALVGLTGVPVAIGIAVLRYRLNDVGTIVNRTLVYGALSIGVTAVYVGTVVGVGTALDRADGLAASLLATALVAFGFQPLRQRIQHAVDRAMYGERRDPYSVLTGLTRRLRATPDPTGSASSS